jgi:hypothetical protein
VFLSKLNAFSSILYSDQCVLITVVLIRFCEIDIEVLVLIISCIKE